MNNKLVAGLLASSILLGAGVAVIAQGTLANHSIPVAGGAGTQGWRKVGPCTTNQVAAWTSGATADPACADVSTLVAATPLTNTHIFVGNASNIATDVALSGDATLANTGAMTIANNAITTVKIPNSNVTYAKIQNVTNARLLGNNSGGAAAPSEIALDTSLAFSGATTLQRAALTGDVTASAGSNATTIANNAVSNTKLAQMAQSTFKGRAAGAGTGDPTDLTVAQAQVALLHAPIIGGFANNVNFNSVADTSITIASPTTNYRIVDFTIINQGTTASLTTAQFGVFSGAGATGITLVASGTVMTSLTSNAANTATSMQTNGAAIVAFWNLTTVFFRITQAQGAAASGSVYVRIQPLP